MLDVSLICVHFTSSLGSLVACRILRGCPLNARQATVDHLFYLTGLLSFSHYLDPPSKTMSQVTLFFSHAASIINLFDELKERL